VKLHADDLFDTPRDQTEIDFENEGGETYICGNPPYVGDKKQSESQKSDIESIFTGLTGRWKSFDYVTGFIYKSAVFIGQSDRSSCALVATNSVTQGVQVANFWPLAQKYADIIFAHTSFKWSNLAANNAGVTCVILGLGEVGQKSSRTLYDNSLIRKVEKISPYLITGDAVLVHERPQPISCISQMILGNFAKDGGNLIISRQELLSIDAISRAFVRPIFGAQEFIKGVQRFCFWIPEDKIEDAKHSEIIRSRLIKVSEFRKKSKKSATAAWHDRPHRFVEIRSPDYFTAIITPRVSSEAREYLPTGLLPPKSIVTEAFALYDAALWNMALIASRLHLVWIATVCGKMKTDFRYSNTHSITHISGELMLPRLDIIARRV
jgi:hypothetical protein